MATRRALLLGRRAMLLALQVLLRSLPRPRHLGPKSLPAARGALLLLLLLLRTLCLVRVLLLQLRQLWVLRGLLVQPEGGHVAVGGRDDALRRGEGDCETRVPIFKPSLFRFIPFTAICIFVRFVSHCINASKEMAGSERQANSGFVEVYLIVGPCSPASRLW